MVYKHSSITRWSNALAISLNRHLQASITGRSDYLPIPLNRQPYITRRSHDPAILLNKKAPIARQSTDLPIFINRESV